MNLPQINLGKVLIEAFFQDRDLFVNEKQVKPERSLAVRNHSPSGFNWGYGGSGPAQTALAILMELLPIPIAEALYQEFKKDFVQYWAMEKDVRIEIDLKKWLAEKSVYYMVPDVNNPILEATNIIADAAMVIASLVNDKDESHAEAINKWRDEANEYLKRFKNI